MERQGGDLRLFWLLARLAFSLLYTSTLTWMVVRGYSLGEKLAGRGVIVSAASVIALGGLMAITLPSVDYMSTCLVGTAFVLTDTTC